ncbi:hypothetical protein NA57DRAFT_58305 [Rhizodiscina lignyota]|uniref:CAP-Gly domain-containing protein n=1 Tax=Rhizodiscina lignyota TaxID=1504668 RepID=A0A9P4M6J4_9PEZI|nr:hypothetical protein NA57DRAFT_58305 [Rhizodiscina lignyota]
MATNYKIGQSIELNDGRVATIRFVGETSFQTGEWVGVEFEDSSGKNDGSVQGERYFDCEPGHGMFLRPSSIVRIVQQPAPRSPTKLANGKPMGPPPAKSRPSSVSSRPSSVVGPSSRPRPSLSAAASKRSSLAGPSSSRDSSTGASKRVSMAPTPTAAATAARRQSSIRPTSISGAPASKPPPTAARKSLGPSGLAGLRQTGTTSGSRLSIVGSVATPSRILSPASATRGSPIKSPSPTRGLTAPLTPTARTAALSTTPRTPATSSKEVEDLQTKLRVMEKKRLEDRERLKTLEKLQEERDRFEMIIQKLQSKYQPQQQEVVELKKQLKESESKFQQIEGIQAEHDSIMEMATLDREMAEEKAEVYRTELDAVKSRLEEVELENEILRDENLELGKDMSPEERTSQGWLQMERENERLREALLRLRDMSQEQESQLRDEILSLEEDVKDFSVVKTQYDDTKAKLLECEADIEDLRQQLEAAMGADDLIEQLTERNLALGEQLEELRATIEDLESLKELNDELEVNHVEHEKQLQDAIDYKDNLIAEAARRAAQQDETLSDQEYTLSRFRELVTNLQADLEDMRASKEITETEAQALDSRSRAMMDLNRQLQASATNTRVKTIEMELRKMEAQEAAEHLAIVQLFLPDTFHAERDSVLALLRFKRVAFKARMLHNFVRDRVVAQDGGAAAGEHVFYACHAMDQLVWISTMCDRFVNSISGCSLEQFARFEGALYEVEPVERTLNGYIELLKKDELQEDQVAEGLERSIAVMSHLSEIHLREGLESYADEVLMKTQLMQSHLESTAAALQNAKVAILLAIPHAADDDTDEVNLLADRTEEMIAFSRSARVIVSKTLRSLQEMKARSLSLQPNTVESFDDGRNSTEDLAAYARKLGQSLFNLLHEEGRTEPAGLGDVLPTMRRVADTSFSTSESEVFSTFTFKLRALTERLADLNSMASDLDMTTEFERTPAPWVLRSKELQDSKLISVDAQEEIRRLKDEVHERATQLKLRDQNLEEAGLKIEHLESRMRDAGMKVNRIVELEKAVEDGKTRLKDMVDEVDKQMREMEEVQADRDKWKTAAAEVKVSDATQGSVRAGDLPVGSLREMDSLKSQVKHLEVAIKYLKDVARRKQREEEAANTAWLSTPLVPPREQKQKVAEIKREGFEWLDRLTSLPSTAKMIKLEPQEKKLKWQPKKMTPQYQLSEQELLALDAWPMKAKFGGEAMGLGFRGVEIVS